METILTDHEVRLLGCLIEKEMATPDYYPLTLNALINACNQKSNRNPVVSYDEETVRFALRGLQESKMVRQSNVSRVPKYEQIFSDDYKFTPREKATICILMLRGPQTIGEIRGRTERLHSFASLDEVKEALSSLEDTQLVKKLPRLPGRKESRYTHLLSGDPGDTLQEIVPQREAETVIIRRDSDRGNENRRNEMQEQIESLQQELQELRREFETFKSQFD